MADNVTADPGSGGAVFRTEDKSSVHTPVSIIDIGGSGAESLLTAGQAAMAASIPVVIASDQSAIAATVSGVATSAKQDTAAAILTTIDADTGALAACASGTELQVDIVTSALPSGAATSAKQDTIIGHVDGLEGLLTTIDGDTGNISTKIDTVAGAVSGTEMQVDVVTSALPTGAATAARQDTGNTSLGTIAGAVSGTEMQVDVVTSALPSGAATAAKQPALGTAGTASADVITVQGIASMTALKVDGSAVTQPVSGTVTVTDGSGSLTVDGTVGVSGTVTVSNGGTFATQSTIQATSSGGVDTFKSTDIDETEEDVKTSAGQVYWIYAVNTHASALRWLKLWNATAANVTVGSTATKMDLPIPPNNSGFYLNFPTGVPFSTAISVGCTTGAGDADTGAPGASEVYVAIGYK